MEILFQFGMACVAALFYALLAAAVFTYGGHFAQAMRLFPILVAITVAAEVLALIRLGALPAYQRFGSLFLALEFFNLFAAPAAAANLSFTFFLRPQSSPPHRFTAVALASIAFVVIAIPSILLNVFISEAIFGVDGLGIPPSMVS